MISLQNVYLRLTGDEREVTILNGIDLDFSRGKMYAITGPNGSGKSTLARVIMGIQTPTKGKLLFDGEDITSLGLTERAHKGFGYAFQHPARFKGMRVLDMLEIAMRMGDDTECTCLRKIGLCPEDYLERPLDSSLSGGEMKRIEIATILAQDPRVRIFDEPEAGIDLWSFERLISVIGSSHDQDRITIIISHQEKILNMVDEIILIDEGKVKMRGDRETMWNEIYVSAMCSCGENCKKEDGDYAQCIG